MNLIDEIKEKFQTVSVTENGFIIFVNVGADELLPISLIHADGLIALICDIAPIESYSAQEILDACAPSIYGVAINGQSYAFKHVVRISNLNFESFIKELELMGAAIQELRP